MGAIGPMSTWYRQDTRGPEAVICPESPSPRPAPHPSRPPRLPVFPLSRPQSSHLYHEGWVG